jgi:serine/threonine-protein kinase
VLDFGISKVTSQSGSGSDMGMTRTQSIMGSPLYMSPEQMASAKDVDQRSDIWAIGCVLYELVTGRVPFEAETMPQLCTLILHTDPPPPRSIRADVPELLDQVILRCLRKDRNQRYADVAMLAADLAAFSPDAGPRSAARISRVLSSSGISSPALRAVWYGLVGVGAAAVLGVVLWKAASGHPAPPPDVSTAAAPSKPPSEPMTAAAALPATPNPVTAAAPSVVAPAVVGSAELPVAGAAVAGGKKPAHPVTGKGKPPAEGGKPKAPGEPSVDPLSERN